MRRSADTVMFRPGALPPIRTGKSEKPDEERRAANRPVARFVSAILEPIWYWLDLLGQDDHPSHSKIMATAAVAVGLAVVALLAGGLAAAGKSPDSDFTFLALGVIGFALGHDYGTSRRTMGVTGAAAGNGGTEAPTAPAGQDNGGV